MFLLMHTSEDTMSVLCQCRNSSTYRSGRRGGCSNGGWSRCRLTAAQERNGSGLTIFSFFTIHSFFHFYHVFLLRKELQNFRNFGAPCAEKNSCTHSANVRYADLVTSLQLLVKSEVRSCSAFSQPSQLNPAQPAVASATKLRGRRDPP